jgi:hypothetical protein
MLFKRHKVTESGAVEYRREGSTATFRTGPKMFEGTPPESIEIVADTFATVDPTKVKVDAAGKTAEEKAAEKVAKQAAKAAEKEVAKAAKAKAKDEAKAAIKLATEKTLAEARAANAASAAPAGDSASA